MTEKCTMCNGSKWDHFETVMDNYQTIMFWMCQRCGMVTQLPRMTEAELEFFYEEVYRDGTKLYDLVEFEARRAEVQFKIISPYLDTVEKMLDVGCSTGRLLDRFRRNWPKGEYVGSEPNPFVGNYSQRDGFSVVKNANSIVKFTTGFDLITTVHSLEHMNNPVLALYDLLRLAAPTCLLYVEVPNLLGDIALEKAHLHAFTEETLWSLIYRSGWKPLWLLAHGAPKHESLECYLSVMAVKKDKYEYEDISSPGGIRKKRKWAMLKRMWAIATYRGENGR